jgi:leucyl aminopeptidase
LPDCLLPAAAGPAVPVHAVTPATLDEVAARLGASDLVAATGFKAAVGATLLVPAGGGALAAVLFGIGEAGSPDRPPLLAGRLPSQLPAGTYSLAGGFEDPGSAALAFALGAYRFTRYRRAGSPSPRLVWPDGVDQATVGAIADGVYLARDLINTAANGMGPAELAEAARSLAARHDARLTLIEASALRQMNFPMIHTVGIAAAPDRQPLLIDVTWGRPSDPKVTLIGKGVCFDTGGLDIKTPAGMLLMKKDMGGAANVLGLAHMIMATGQRVRLRVLIPAVENAISGAAFRPGDVLTSRKGLTVEIGNTDAEGRLILADGLAYAAEEEPDLIVDMATLTGAARTALGPEVVPFYTADDAFAADLMAASRAVADPVWRMPLWQPYETFLESKIADINNAGSSAFAGSITAALFLARFVPPGQRWLHADIYAWNPSTKPGRPEGGEAQAIRALFSLIQNRYRA